MPSEGPVRYHSSCGLTPAQTTRLAARAWQVDPCRPHRATAHLPMPFGTSISSVPLIARYNLAQQVAASLCAISQPTVPRNWRYLLALIGQAPRWTANTLRQGTPAWHRAHRPHPDPTGSRAGTRATNFIGKHRKWVLNIQVAARLSGASTRCRGRLSELPSVIHTATGLEFYHQTAPIALSAKDTSRSQTFECIRHKVWCNYARDDLGA